MEINFDNYTIRTLSKNDENAILELCMKCKDFYESVEGTSPDKTCVVDFLESLPPGKAYDDKFPLGVYEGNNLISLVDLVRDYPSKDEWTIGLLIISIDYRGKGLGKAINTAIAKKAKEMGASKLRIGVAEANASGYAFWKKIGYYEIGRTKPTRLGNKDNIVIIMNYTL